MPAALLQFEQETYWQECIDCGVPFGVTQKFEEARRRDGKSFFCPNGHSMIYRELAHQKVQREMQAKLDAAQQRLEWEQAQSRTAREEAERHKKALKRQTKRVNAGVCPHCNRTFQQLARHMQCKHAEEICK